MGGMDFGAVMDLVNGIMGANKPGKNGEGSELDKGKIALVLLSFAGRQGFSWYMSGRRKKKTAKAVARGVKLEDLQEKKKGSKFLPGLVVGTLIGAAGYLAIMKPEDRQELFKTIDKIVSEGLSLINEIQGKPFEG